jgi:hypothetical protein
MLFATKVLALVVVVLVVLVAVVVVVVGVGALSKAAAYPPFAVSAVDDVVLLAAVVVDAASEDFVDWLTFSLMLSTDTGGSTNAGKCFSSWILGGVAFFGLDDDG